MKSFDSFPDRLDGFLARGMKLANCRRVIEPGGALDKDDPDP